MKNALKWMLSATLLAGVALFGADKDAGDAGKFQNELKAIDQIMRQAAKDAPKNAELAWGVDFQKALQAAASQKCTILVLFTGSDWCPWCQKLSQQVWETPEFKEFASKNLVLFMADFPKNKWQTPQQKKEYRELQQRFEVEGYPTVLLLDSNGNVLGKTGYRPGGGKVYVEHLKALTRQQ